jgi:DNA repair protein RadD
VQELLDLGYLAPLVRPVDLVRTRINTDDISTASGDFNLSELAERVGGYLVSAADDACTLAAGRKKWLAFLPTVLNARAFSQLLAERGITASVVTGETPKKEREALIEQFRRGELRCLVTVLALATGFDVPDVDCIC